MLDTQKLPAVVDDSVGFAVPLVFEDALILSVAVNGADSVAGALRVR